MPGAAGAQSVPVPWQTANVGAPAITGSATSASGEFSINGAGTGIAGTSDQFMYVYRSLTDDGAIVARVSSIDPAYTGAKAGVMMRDTLAANAKHVFVRVSEARGSAFERRRTTGGAAVQTPAEANAAPMWVKLERRGAVFGAFRSTDGVNWTAMGTEIVSMRRTVFVGLAVTSHNAGGTTTATFGNATVTPWAPLPPGPLPPEWTSADVGVPTVAGAAQYDGGTFDVTGAGTGVKGDHDEFRYMYREIQGDVDLVARVNAVQVVNANTKAGVMLRDSLTPNAAHASMFVTPGGTLFQRRPQPGGPTQKTSGGSLLAPMWVRIERHGTVVTASQSTDGLAWTVVGKVTLTLPTMYVGLAVTSSAPATPAKALFDEVTLQTGELPNKAPTVDLSSPVDNVTLTAPASLTVSATASDADGTVARVDFYAGTTLIGTANVSPFSMMWQGVAAGTYVIAAVATDDKGASTTSAAQTLVVNARPTVSLTSPAAGAAYKAPASVTMTATAADADGGVAAVDFFADSTLIGSDTSAPYSVTWNNVAAGTHTLTAVARDDRTATTTSTAVSIIVVNNRPPIISLSAPADGASFTAPAAVTLSATASDTDGTIATVSFYAGTTLIGSDTTSPYGITWNNVAQGTYSLTAVARDNDGATITSAARSITVNASLPSGWTAADIGQPAIAGATRHGAGTFTVDGAGVDIWGSSDQLQFVYRQFTGDIEIIGHVVSLENTHGWAKAGVMIRETLAANAAHASLVVTPANGTNFERRLTPGALTQAARTGPSAAPYWVRLERRGTAVTAFQSPDGATWTAVGTMTMATPTMYVGFVVTSHDVTQAATGVFDNVVVRTPAPVNQAPTVTLTGPANGATFTFPATITVTATASDFDGTVASVSFYAGTTLIGSDKTSPYSVTWSNGLAGTYSLTAVATDDGGATTTSAARTITVGTPPPPMPSRAVFVASANHTSAVDRYVLNIYASGANPDTAAPVATKDMGKPAVANGECNVDISQTVLSLAPGNYVATVTAIGTGGSAKSTPSAAFTR